MRKTKCIIFFLFFLFSFSFSPTIFANNLIEKTDLTHLTLISNLKKENKKNLDLIPAKNIGLEINSLIDGAIGRFSWKQEKHLLFDLMIKMTTETTSDNALEADYFKGLSFAPSISLNIPDLFLKVKIDGIIVPLFSSAAFSQGEFSFQNQLKYDVQIDLLNLLYPKKRNFLTSIYLSGNLSRHSSFEDFAEQRITNSTETQIGLHYEKENFVDIDFGLVMTQAKKIDLSLPQGKEERLSRLNLDIMVKFFFPKSAITVSFTPILERTGNIQESQNVMISLTSHVKL